MPVYEATSGDVGAAVIDGLVGSLVNVLDAVLIIGRVVTTPDDAAFTDRTAEARTAGGTPFALFPTPGTSDRAYLGMQGRVPTAGDPGFLFSQLRFDLATLGVGGSYAWDYWTGAAWSTLSVADGTNGFTQNGIVAWTPPSDMATRAVGGVTMMWVRVRPTSAPSTAPTVNSVSSLGWTRAYSGTNKAAYQQAPKSGRLQLLLRVQDDGPGSHGGREARCRGYEAMTDVDTGTGLFPTVAQMTNGWIYRKSSAASSVTRFYRLVADERLFHLLIITGDVANTYWGYSFGDGYSRVPSDQYCVLGNGRTAEATTDNTIEYWGSVSASTLTSNTPSHYVARAYTGAGSSLLVGRHTDYIKNGGTAVVGGANSLPYPNPPDGKLWVAPIWIHEPGDRSLRGFVRGVWCPLHVGASFTDGDIFSVGGRTLRIVRIVHSASSLGAAAVEISNTWETD